MAHDTHATEAQTLPVMPGLAGLPEFPGFVPVAADQKALLEAAFQAVQPEITEFTWAYLWVWGRLAKAELSQFRGSILIRVESLQDGERYLLPPVVPDPEEAADITVAALTSFGSNTPRQFGRLTQTMVDRVKSRTELIVTEEPGRADYVYLGDNLRDLPGRRYHRKRNHIRQFWAACPGATYHDMDDDLAEKSAPFCRGWLANHRDRDLPSLVREVNAAIEMIQHRDWLGLTGGVMLLEDRVIACSVGEPINREIFTVRAEKADASVPGAYQVINQEFARHAAADFKWINREQDVGVPGIQQAKSSYYPHHMLPRFRVRLA
jgi:hypothetical protein